MFHPPRDVLDALSELNSTYRFVSVANGMKRDPLGQFVPDEAQRGHIRAEIIDLTLHEVYAAGIGEEHVAALRAGIAVARTAEKPLTPAQRADGRIKAQAERIKELESEVAALKGEHAPLNDTGSGPSDGDGAGPVSISRNRRRAIPVGGGAE